MTSAPQIRNNAWVGFEGPPPADPAQAHVEGKRFGSPIHTFTGREFWPMDPRAADVDIEDIAHALSMQCRYAGHGLQFYSVGEHSVRVAGWLSFTGEPRSTILQGLLHDATEAYLVDVPRPVKAFLVGYREAEAKVWEAVAQRFDLPLALAPAVHQADNRIIADEMAQNMVKPDPAYNDPLGITLQFWSPKEAEAQFLSTFYKLTEPV